MPSAVDLWQLNLSGLTGERASAWLPCLEPEERKRFEAFRFEKDRLQFLAAHTIKRNVLSEYLSGRPRDFRFGVNAWGKPHLLRQDPGPPLGFNLSHTGGLVACVVAATLRVGVDVERIDRETDHLSLARHSFTKKEYELLLAQPIESRAAFFFRLWTLKEAFVKAEGLGLSHAFDSFEVDMSDEGVGVVMKQSSVKDEEDWHFFENRPSEFHQLAVAVSGEQAATHRVTVRDARELPGLFSEIVES